MLSSGKAGRRVKGKKPTAGFASTSLTRPGSSARTGTRPLQLAFWAANAPPVEEEEIPGNQKSGR